MGVKAVISVVVLYVLGAVGVSWWFWDCLSWGEPSTSAAIRNIVLTLGTPLAIFLAVWRSVVAQKQVEATQASLLSARYQRAVEMLDHDKLPIRIGGISALCNLAREHNEYRREVMNLIGKHFMTSDISMDQDEAKELREAIMQLADRDDPIRELAEGFEPEIYQ